MFLWTALLLVVKDLVGFESRKIARERKLAGLLFNLRMVCFMKLCGRLLLYGCLIDTTHLDPVQYFRFDEVMAASLKVFWEDPYLDPYSSTDISLGLGVLRQHRCPQGLHYATVT